MRRISRPALARSFRSVHSAFDGLLYPIFAIALGVVAVGVLNLRHWQGFRQSMAASFQAVLVIFKITVGTLILAALVATAWKGPVAFLVAVDEHWDGSGWPSSRAM